MISRRKGFLISFLESKIESEIDAASLESNFYSSLAAKIINTLVTTGKVGHKHPAVCIQDFALSVSGGYFLATPSWQNAYSNVLPLRDHVPTKQRVCWC